jgi:hypothetical protein
MSDRLSRFTNHVFRRRVGVILFVLGLLLAVLGIQPSMFGVDRSPITGFIQIVVFLVGMAFLCIGGHLALASLWNGYQKTIAADIGVRLVATGYVVVVGSAMADIFGFGSQTMPDFIPSFGDWQKLGVLIGQGMIAAGFILMMPWKQSYTGQP